MKIQNYNTELDELLDCPFCGGRPIAYFKGNESGIVYDALPPFWYVTYRCNECRIVKDVRVEQSKDTRLSSEKIDIKVGGTPSLTFDINVNNGITLIDGGAYIAYQGNRYTLAEFEQHIRADERAKVVAEIKKLTTKPDACYCGKPNCYQFREWIELKKVLKVIR